MVNTNSKGNRMETNWKESSMNTTRLVCHAWDAQGLQVKVCQNIVIDW